MAPPNGRGRFTVVLDGTDVRELMDTWSDLCQPGAQAAPSELRAVYPFLTTVQGNRFHFRGGDPAAMSGYLTNLFEGRLHGQKIQARVES